MKRVTKTFNEGVEQVSDATQYLKPEQRNLSSDVMAAFTFAVVNIPQAMGHALLATVNPLAGIYTLITAVPVGALFTSSVFMNVSTTSALAVAIAAGLEAAPAGSKTEALAVIVLLVGIMQLLAGLFRLGFLIRFVSHSVMTGFLNGVAVLIILGQLGDVTGYASSYSNRVAKALDLFLHPAQVDIPTTIIGGLTLGLILLLLRSRWSKFAFIVAIAVSTLALTVLSQAAFVDNAVWQQVQTVGDIADISNALPELALPSANLIAVMLLPALSITVIGLIQGAGISQAFPNPDGKYPNVSRDFIGQGVANIATSFVGGIPAGGSVSGTNLIMSAGARSRWTNILIGAFVAILILIAAPLVELVPMPSLAALLIVAGFQALRLESAMTIWQTGRVSSAVMVLTFLATLFIPLQYAVLVGMAFSILLHVVQQANQVMVTEWVLAPGRWPEERPSPAELPSHQFIILQIYGSLFFAAAKTLEESLPSVDNSTHAVVALGLRGQSEIGSTFITVLYRYSESLRAHNGRLMLVGVGESVREQLIRTGIINSIGEENIFMAVPQLGDAINKAAAVAYAWLEETVETEPETETT